MTGKIQSRREVPYNPFSWSRRTRHNFVVGMLFLSPWIVGFAVFTLYPMLASLVYSFSEYTFHQPLQWVGLLNYQALLRDPYFWIALGNTAYMVLIGVPLILCYSFLCALALNMRVRGQSIYRVIYYMPAIVPMIAGTLLWIWMLNPRYGLINSLLGSVGITGPNWLKDPLWSKPALLLLALWGAGNVIIIYLSGLQDVPRHILEAADLDGANWWQTLRHITWPMVSPITLYNLITLAIVMFQYFAEAYLFAQVSGQGISGLSTVGQPLNSTLFYSVYLYQNAFQFLKIGYASAMAWLLLLVILAFTVVLMKVADRFTFYSE